MRVDITVFDGLDEMDALGPLEVFRSAQRLGADIDTRLVTFSKAEKVRGAFGLRFRADAVYVLGEADVLVVVGGGWASRSDVGAWGEVQRGDWLPLIAGAAETSRLIAGVRTGSLILAHAGLLEGRRANTHHAAQEDLRALGVTVVDDRVVDDGDLVTSGGVTSGIDLALWVVEREVSREAADEVAARMEYERFRPAVVATPDPFPPIFKYSFES